MGALIDRPLKVPNAAGKLVAGRLLRDVDSGDEVHLAPLGKGSFATVYYDVRLPDRVFAYIPDDCGDNAKEILAMTQRGGYRNPHLPVVRHLGNTEHQNVYVMARYRAPLRAGDSPAAWKAFRAIAECWQLAQRRLWESKSMTGYDVMCAVVDCAAERAAVTPDMVEALEMLRDTAADYGDDHTFEFSPRNLATDAAGNLILLDVVFSRNAMERIRVEQDKKRKAAQPNYRY